MSRTVDQLIWAIAPFCAFGEASARTTATVIETKPTSRSRISENTAERAEADQGEDLIECDMPGPWRVGGAASGRPPRRALVAVARAEPPVDRRSARCHTAAVREAPVPGSGVSSGS